ncbi:hypothetical protein BD413DRAFT_544453 [Trametes elegans]|nr:hypothetical protein BD413DRAFT_544453 [Trametes elegans]
MQLGCAGLPKCPKGARAPGGAAQMAPSCSHCIILVSSISGLRVAVDHRKHAISFLARKTTLVGPLVGLWTLISFLCLLHGSIKQDSPLKCASESSTPSSPRLERDECIRREFTDQSRERLERISPTQRNATPPGAGIGGVGRYAHSGQM